MELAIAILVGGLSYFTRNLSIALAAGLIIEFGIKYLQKRSLQTKGGFDD